MKTRLVWVAVVSALLGVGCEDKVPEPTPSARPEKSAKPAFEAPKELLKEDVKVGDGPEAQTGDEVKVHYTGRLLKTNAKFDSSLDRGEPFTFKLGEGAVIKGWDQGVVGMKVGGKRKLTIPSDLAYGKAGSPPKIPADAPLVFDVELLEIVGKGAEDGSGDGESK
ncbi:MAG TPA: FKBP-type peptidyl-prolyl cis-trans isomerase [Polyangiaceae bacterium]|nr:FKBP-type peptidyl-prolyl cis-trans isomerase [Polyangiaceae bacterium]